MNTIEETVKMAGLGRRKMMRKQIELFEKELGEELRGVCASHPKPTQQLYITDKQVIAHKIEGTFSNNRTDIPFDSVRSINVSNKGTSATIEIVSSSNSATVSGIPIHIAQEIKSILDRLTN